MPATFIRWDVTKGLGMEESARVYLNACAEEDLGDGGLIRAALNDIARFPNMTPLACQVQNHLMLLSGNSSVSLNACSVSDGEKLHMASKGGLGILLKSAVGGYQVRHLLTVLRPSIPYLPAPSYTWLRCVPGSVQNQLQTL